jgi:hypothetical protein
MTRPPEERLERATLFAIAWIAALLVVVTYFIGGGGACQ